jgi:hypothetical protein
MRCIISIFIVYLRCSRQKNMRIFRALAYATCALNDAERAYHTAKQKHEQLLNAAQKNHTNYEYISDEDLGYRFYGSGL